MIFVLERVEILFGNSYIFIDFENLKIVFSELEI